MGEPPLQIVVALHIGTAIYGNTGAADRIDFTLIGPAVNLVSRILSAYPIFGDGRTCLQPAYVDDVAGRKTL